MVATQAADPKKLKVFISYSRKDVAFAQKIVAALDARGLASKIDTRDLPKLEDWRRELLGFIREADAVVFIVSQNSISSPVCAWEVEQVANLNKRLAPIILERVSDDRIPTAIVKINYLFFDQREDFDARIDELAQALQTDLVWVKEHTRIGELARRWDEGRRATGLTLRGQELQGAERWIASRPRAAPEPTDLQKAFISESRRAATRRLYFTIVGALVIGAVAIGLAAVAFTQSRLAEANRKNAVNILATSDFRQGTSLLENDKSTSEGLALLSRSVREGHDSRALTRLWTLLQQRSFWLPGEPKAFPPVRATAHPQEAVPDLLKRRFKSVVVDGASREVKFISVSADGTRVFTSIGDNAEDTDCQYRIWQSDGTPITSWIKPDYKGAQWVYKARGFLSSDGKVLVLEVIPWRDNGYLQVFDLANNRQVGENIPVSGLMPFEHESVEFQRVQLIEEDPPPELGFRDLAAHRLAEGRCERISFDARRCRADSPEQAFAAGRFRGLGREARMVDELELRRSLAHFAGHWPRRRSDRQRFALWSRGHFHPSHRRPRNCREPRRRPASVLLAALGAEGAVGREPACHRAQGSMQAMGWPRAGRF